MSNNLNQNPELQKMFEEGKENKSIREAMQELEDNTSSDNTYEETQETTIEPVKSAQLSRDEINYRAMRNSMEESERRALTIQKERDEARKALEAYIQQQQKPIEQEEPEPDEDSFVEYKTVKNKIKKLENKIAESERRSYAMATEARLRSEFPDLISVVSADNVKRLSDKFPALAQSIAYNPDEYSKIASLYESIKSTGIYTEQVQQSHDRVTVDRNMNKPRSSAAVSSNPLTKAAALQNGDMSEEQASQLRREMARAISRY